MIAAALLLAGLPAFAGFAARGIGSAGGTGALPGQVDETLSDSTGREAVAALDELRALAELDLVTALVPRGRELVAPGGLLARSGEARAIVARALFEAGEERAADELVSGREALPPAERTWLVIEGARQLLHRDDLAGAARLLRSGDGPPAGGSEAPERGAPPAAPLAGHPEAWILLARVEARAGEPRAAAGLARAFLERAPLHPDAPAAWHLLAQEALTRRDGEAAGQYLTQARELERWHALLQTRRLQVRRNPDASLPHLGLGLAWMQVGDHGRATEIFRELCAAHPGFARGWFHLGEARRAAGDLAGARAAYDHALETDSAQHPARFNRALLELADGDTERARGELELLAGIAAVAEDPTFAAVFLHLARLDLAAGNDERAEARYARYRDQGGVEPLTPR